MTALMDVAKDFFCGCVAGWGAVTVAMPFENIKLKLQSRPNQYSQGDLNVITKTIRQEGLLAFYKGSLVPYIGVGFLFSLQFGVVESMKKVYRKSHADLKGNLPIVYSFISGSYSGIISALLCAPQDHARFKVALNKDKGIGSIAMMFKILKQHGLIKLYRGLWPTLIRDSIGFALYFGCYDTLTPHFKDERGRVSFVGSLLCGSASGLMYFVPMYPVDYVKTRLQSDSLTQPQFKSITDCIRKTARKGLGVFYTGVGLVIIRAFFASSTTFACFQLAKRMVY